MKEVKEEKTEAPTAGTYGGWNLPKEGSNSTFPRPEADSALLAAPTLPAEGSFIDMIDNFTDIVSRAAEQVNTGWMHLRAYFARI